MRYCSLRGELPVPLANALFNVTPFLAKAAIKELINGGSEMPLLAAPFEVEPNFLVEERCFELFSNPLLQSGSELIDLR